MPAGPDCGADSCGLTGPAPFDRAFRDRRYTADCRARGLRSRNAHDVVGLSSYPHASRAALVASRSRLRRQTEAGRHGRRPPPTVAVVDVAPETVPVSSEWIATLDGFVNAQIRPQVSGYLVRRHYREGAMVRKGQVLFEIDPRPFEAVLAQAQAQLAEAQAQLGRTERDVQRDTPLAKERAIAQSQLDNDIQANLAAQAAVKSARRAVETAQLNVGFTKVRSLIDGVAAIATAQIGDLVGPTTLLTTVSQVDPIRAYFSLSEQEYLEVADQINEPVPGKSLWKGGKGLRLTLADGSEYPSRARFSPPIVRSIRRPARFASAPRSQTRAHPAAGPVRPGQRRHAGRHGRPAGAAARGHRAAGQRAAARRGADGKVSVRTVTLGNRVGSRWIVTNGLGAGARRRGLAAAARRTDGEDAALHRRAPGASAPTAGGARAQSGLTWPPSSSAGPIVAIVIADRHRARGPRLDARPAGRAVPRHRAAADHRHRPPTPAPTPSPSSSRWPRRSSSR